MQINEMNIEEVEARIAEISAEIETRSGEELDALKAEVVELQTRKAELVAIETRKAQAEALQSEEVKPDKTIESRKETMTMNTVEVRDSVEYGKAFLKGMKTNDYTEARSLLSGNASTGGQIPVPTFLETEIKNAWEEYQIAGLVKKSYMKGNVKVVFEVSATGAVIHAEGSDAPDEEVITLGDVTLTPANIKKWITVSDEAIEGTTVDTVGYLYAEIAQKIVEKAEEEIIANITSAQVATDATHPGVPALSQNPAIDTILVAEAMLSGKAKNLNIVMNRQTYPAFVKLALEAGYAIDVFDGLKDKVIFSDKLPAFSAASVGNTYAIVGDFGYGYQCNFPNGNSISIVRDDLSLAEKDLVKLVGRQYVGHGVVAPKAFVNIKKATTV